MEKEYSRLYEDGPTKVEIDVNFSKRRLNGLLIDETEDNLVLKELNDGIYGYPSGLSEIPVYMMSFHGDVAMLKKDKINMIYPFKSDEELEKIIEIEEEVRK